MVMWPLAWHTKAAKVSARTIAVIFILNDTQTATSERREEREARG